MKKYYFLLPVIALLVLGAGCEREGAIDISDCRTTIPVEESSFDASIHTYTCGYTKNDKGQIYGGMCCRAKVSAFSGKCEEAYCYEVKSRVVCGINEVTGENGSCRCAKGYYNNNGSCVYATCPNNSVYDDSLASCECSDGFEAEAASNLCIQSTCPANSHLPAVSSKVCDCDDGYYYISGECRRFKAFTKTESKEFSSIYSNPEGRLRGIIKDVGNYDIYCQQGFCGTQYEFIVDEKDQSLLNNEVISFYIPNSLNSKISTSDVGRPITVKVNYIDGWSSEFFSNTSLEIEYESVAHNIRTSVKLVSGSEDTDIGAAVTTLLVMMGSLLVVVYFYRKHKKVKKSVGK